MLQLPEKGDGVMGLIGKNRIVIHLAGEKKHTQILQLDIKMPPIPDLYFLLVVNKHLLHENLYLATPFL